MEVEIAGNRAVLGERLPRLEARANRLKVTEDILAVDDVLDEACEIQVSDDKTLCLPTDRQSQALIPDSEWQHASLARRQSKDKPTGQVPMREFLTSPV